jgi:hypothetical protein
MKVNEPMDFRIRLLVVTYRTSFDASDTLTSIARFFAHCPEASRNFTLSVWDNSPFCRKQELMQFLGSTPLEVTYTSTPENLALCKVYNQTIADRKNFDYLCILDQDTALTDEYFNETLVLGARSINLALPQIYSNDFLFSPSHRKFCLGRHFHRITAGAHLSRNMLAINSGMMVKASVFDKVSYDERIAFYGTDTWFMVQYEKHYAELHVMESKLSHSLRIRQENSLSWRRNYFKNQIQINKIIFDNGIIERIVTWLYCRYLGLFHARN